MKCHKMREYKKKYSVSGYFPSHCGNFVWYAKNLPNIFAEASFEFSTMVCIKFPAKKIIKPILFPPSFSQMKLFRIFPLDTNGVQTKACDLNTTMDGHSFFLLVIAGDMSFVIELATIHTIFKQMRGKGKNLSMGRTSITSLSPRKLITGFQWKFIIPSELHAEPAAYLVQIARNPTLKFCLYPSALATIWWKRSCSLVTTILMVSINLVKIEFLNAFLNKWFKIAEQRHNGWTELQCSLMLHFMCITPQVHCTSHNVHCTPYIVIKVDGFDL